MEIFTPLPPDDLAPTNTTVATISNGWLKSLSLRTTSYFAIQTSPTYRACNHGTIKTYGNHVADAKKAVWTTVIRGGRH